MGVGLGGPPLLELAIALKRIYIALKALDFSYILKTKILKKKKNPIFLPHPPSEGGTKKMKILKGGRRA